MGIAESQKRRHLIVFSLIRWRGCESRDPLDSVVPGLGFPTQAVFTEESE